MQIVEQTGLSWSGVNAALRLFEQGGAAALKPPPSPPALIQQHLIAGEWAAAGLVDTDLSFLSLLELYGTEISERRMPTRRVVEALDVVEHI